jgi:hypothetical protein
MKSKISSLLSGAEHEKWVKKNLNTPIKVANNDFVLGLLWGEIIWRSLLSKHTSGYNLINLPLTEEEREKENILNKTWLDGYFALKANMTAEENDLYNKSKALFKDYRSYAKSISIKYLPHALTYTDRVIWRPNDIKEFFNGIETFLWNTDMCEYSFTEKDIVITEERLFRVYELTIAFTLSDLKESNGD